MTLLLIKNAAAHQQKLPSNTKQFYLFNGRDFYINYNTNYYIHTTYYFVFREY